METGNKKIKKTNKKSLFDRCLDFFVSVSDVVMGFVVLIICTEVVMRYFFDKPQSWVLETTEYSMVFITFFGAAWLLRKDGHVKIDVLSSRLSDRTQLKIDLVISFLAIAAFLVVLWFGIYVVVVSLEKNAHTQSALQLPKAPLLAMIPIGAVLLIVQLIRRIKLTIAELRGPVDTDTIKLRGSVDTDLM